jgi:small-conductance mechanosensitive channel
VNCSASRLAFVSFLGLAGLFAPSAGANEAGRAAAVHAAPPAKLEIGGRDIITLRATLFGYDPAARAEGARQRLISAYLKNPKVRLTTRHVAEGSQVLADGSIMFLIANGDVNASAGVTTEQEAERVIEVLYRIIEERAQRTDPQALLQGGGLALVATLVAFLLLRLVFALDRRLGLRTARAISAKAERVTVSGVAVLDPALYLRVVRGAARLATWLIAALIVFLWLDAVLESLPFTRPWGERLTSALVDVLSTVGKGFMDSIPGLLFIVVIVAIARLATQTVQAFLDRIVERDVQMGWLDKDTAPPTRMILIFVIWVFAIAMAYPYLPGSDSRALQGLSVLVGLMVSIGASSTVGQAASGLILMYTRVFRVGEYVRIQDTEGTVTELGMFVTRVRTGLGEEVMLPNSMVLANTSKNYSRAHAGTGFVIDTTVTIGYDTPWRQVSAMLTEAARRTPGITTDPEPRVFQTALSDFYPEYRLVAYSQAKSPYTRAQALDRLHANIQDVFNEHGVQIMSPHYLGDPESAKVVPKARWFEAPAKPDDA